MKRERFFKVVAYILVVLIAVTAILSVAFVLSPFFTRNEAPEYILSVLVAMNILIPSFGIGAMIVFIYLKRKIPEN